MHLRGMSEERQKDAKVIYKGHTVSSLRIDLLVEQQVVVEIKSVTKRSDVATAQVPSYLKATGLKRGLLLKFGLSKLIDGITRLSL